MLFSLFLIGSQFVAVSLLSGYISVHDIKQGSSPFVGPLPSLNMGAAHPSLASSEQLRFIYPKFFRAGEIQNRMGAVAYRS